MEGLNKEMHVVACKIMHEEWYERFVLKTKIATIVSGSPVPSCPMAVVPNFCILKELRFFLVFSKHIAFIYITSTDPTCVIKPEFSIRTWITY